MTNNDNAAFAAVAAELPSQSSDSLRAVNELVAEVRSLDLQLADIDERRAALAAKAFEIRTKKLVDLMSTLGVKSISIDAQGNDPAYEAKLKPYYKAGIPADWPPEQRQRAFDWLDANGDGDLIKHVFVVALPREEAKLADKVRKALAKLGVEVDEQNSVHHATLTAWLKEQIEKKKRTGIPLDVLGATVGQIVDVKPVRQK